MFSLIISIVSIALVVALVAATMYHGGDTLTQGRDRADAAALVSGAQQITGAAAMFVALEGAAPTAIDGTADDGVSLVGEGYLSSVPNGDWTLDATAGTLSADVASAAVCQNLIDDASDVYSCALNADQTAAPGGVFTYNF